MCNGVCIFVGSSEQCSVAHYHAHSYPLGKTHVEGLRVLSGNVSFNECLSLCCNEGPSQCGYLWLFGTRCVALPCITNKTACSPRTLTSLPSVLVEIKYDGNHVTSGTYPFVVLYIKLELLTIKYPGLIHGVPIPWFPLVHKVISKQQLCIVYLLI